MVRESTSSRETPPAVTSALRKPIVPATGMSSRLTVLHEPPPLGLRDFAQRQLGRRSAEHHHGFAHAVRQPGVEQRGGVPLARGGLLACQEIVQFCLGQCRQQVAPQPQRRGPRVAAHQVADVQNRRARDAEVSKQQGRTIAGQGGRRKSSRRRFRFLDVLTRRLPPSPFVNHLNRDIGQRDPLQFQHPGCMAGDWHKRRVRSDNAMAQRGRPAVSVTGGSATRIRLPSGRQHDLFRFDRALGCSQLEELV